MASKGVGPVGAIVLASNLRDSPQKLKPSTYLVHYNFFKRAGNTVAVLQFILVLFCRTNT